MYTKSIVLILIGLAAIVAVEQTSTVTVTGFLTDTPSGRSGATALNVESAKHNVASGKAKYAIYDEATRKLYILAPQDTAVAYLGQRVKITGTLSASPLTRAGQSYAPDAVATPKDSSGNADQSNAARMVSGDPSAPAGPGPAHVQTHNKALDYSTPIAGVLTISSVQAAPLKNAP